MRQIFAAADGVVAPIARAHWADTPPAADKGTITVRVTDGEERTFKKGDIFEAVDLAPCKGRLSKSEDGAVALLTNHP